MKQEQIIKKVTAHISGTGGICGRVYLPKRFLGKVVLVREVWKYEIKEWKREEKKKKLEEKKKDEKLKKHLQKLREIRKTHKV